jgi:hypothetical protein
MKRKRAFFLLGIFLLITTACAGQSGTKDISGTPTSFESKPVKIGSGEGAFFSIDEVGLGPNGFVALTNFTDNPANLGGLYLCQGNACYELPEVVVDSGETARIAVGDGAGIEGEVVTHATIGELRSADGEVALTISPNVQKPEEVLAYLQWGTTTHQLTELAIQAGLWLEGSYAPTSQNATRLFIVKETGLWLFE